VPEILRIVAIGELAVSQNHEDVLVAYGLGSCVAVCLYDPVRRAGGMLHALLPTAPQGHPQNSLPKFVDRGVVLLIDALTQLGAKPNHLVAQLCGGAQMLSTPGLSDSLKIGERNLQAANAALRVAGVPIRARAVGGSTGRTAKLYVADGQVTVKSVGKNEVPIANSE
jgi:chemotaxis protein CheD